MERQGKHTPGYLAALAITAMYDDSDRDLMHTDDLAELINRKTAAPELLEALRQLWQNATSHGCKDCQHIAAIAIAKATNQES